MSGSDHSIRLRELAGFRNLRDLGGLPAAGGGTTRPGLVYRSEAPTGLDDEQLAELRVLGLKSAIDLRHQAGEDVFVASTLPETVRRLDAGILPPADPSGKGLLQQVMDGELNEYSAAQLGEMYVDFLDTRAPAFGRAVSYIADPDNLPTLIHCHAGKDRTGIVVAIVLEMIGVPRPLIVEDYELTTIARAYRRAEVEGALRDVGTEWGSVAPLFTAPRESLEIALDHLVSEFGSVREYLLGPGEASEDVPGRLAGLLTLP
jgi:protein-tyrosine phosphatase